MSELAKALVEAQKELPAVPKNATANTGAFTYHYVTLDSLISKTLPILNKHGLAITQAPEHIEGYGFGLRTTLHHEGGEALSSVMPIHSGHSMQDLGGAITYARRYAWAALLGIASEHDDDAGNVSAQPAQAQSPTKNAKAEDTQGLQSSRADAVQPGQVIVPFGKHKGSQVKDVPRNYWDWWLAQDGNKNPEVLAAVELHLRLTDGPQGTIDEDIPF